MKRRQFTKNVGLCAAALGMGRASALASAGKQSEVAVTLDDFVLFDTPALSAAARNRAILDALDGHKLKAAMFVAGKNVDNEKNLPLVRLWDERGHMIANHTYSHKFYHNADFQEYAQDILRNEALLKQFSHFRKFLRFPFLKEGKTAEQRDRMRAFMREHGYRNGHVTIDASDWYVDQRLRERLKTSPQADLAPYRDYYLDHIWERATFYDDLARKVLGRGVKHTLLLHHNVLNGLFLGDLLRMFKRKGWKLVDAEKAYTDPLFNSAPQIVPAGESLIWALAKEAGKYEKVLRYPGEDSEFEKARMDALGL
ncbi:MAG: polysaccharide deacetylase family protein [Acidobacteria bacterium]|nr:polysaccharide deacetylase family protein [Acidobacteriota bacterium]